MPAKLLMTWEPETRRWRKWLGRPFVVSCRQLAKWAGHPVPATQEGSYQVANAWWKAKLAELGAVPIDSPHAPLIAELKQRAEWARRNDHPKLAQGLDKQVKELSNNPNIVLEEGSIIDIEELRSFANQPLVQSLLWIDRLHSDSHEQTPEDRTIGGQVSLWLERRRKKVGADALSAGAYDNTRFLIEYFRDWAGAALSVESLNEEKLESYHGHLLDKIGERKHDPVAGWSRDYAKKAFGVARSFINSLGSKRIITLPANINSREFRFDVRAKPIVTMTTEEVQRLIQGADSHRQLKLHLLLMLNCGMTQTDIADLLDDEVDWEEGRITRKRSKTSDNAKVPTVGYKLWSVTFQLLKKHRSGQKIVLLTKSGGHWTWEEIGADGKLRGSDNIATNYNRLRKKLGIEKSLKIFRKTSSTRVHHHPVYGRLASLFLGHAPRSMAEVSYVAEAASLLDEAVGWLGSEYGLV